MKPRTRSPIIVSCALLSLLCVPAAVHAERYIHLARVTPAGDVDTAFADDGHFVDTVETNTADSCSDVIVTTAGKLLFSINSSDPDGFLWVGRLDANGVPDPTFGNGSGYTSMTAGTDVRTTAIGLYGKKPVVVGSVAGTYVREALVVRLYEHGNPDFSFGGSGRVNIGHEGWHLGAEGVAVQSDGKIVVAGKAFSTAGESRFFVARLTSAGVLDTSFSQDGKILFTFPGTTASSANDVVITNGEGMYPWIVVAGSAIAGGRETTAVAYLRQNGDYETNFDGDGRALIPITGTADRGRALTYDSYARAIVAGIAYVDGNWRYTLARVQPNGVLDPTFDGNGKLSINMGSLSEDVYDVYIGQSGRITMVGAMQASNGQWRAGIARFNDDGSPHNAFSGNAKMALDDPLGLADNWATGAHYVGGDKIVTCGVAKSP